MKAIFWIGKSGIFGRLIRFFKGTGSSHVELMFSNGYAGTSDMEKGGIVYYKIDFKPEDWYVVDIPCTTEEEAIVRKFFEVDEVGCGYDKLGIIFCQVFPWGIHSKTNWFCSEACTSALSRILYFLKGVKPYQVDPGELLDILKENLN